MNKESRQCQNCKQSFQIDAQDFAFYEKISVPPPTWCPQCRLKRRMIFRNFKTLYKRPSDKSGVSLISMYSPKSPHKVYSYEEWWADNWDPKAWGKPFDFSRPFFEQFHELLLAVPRFNLANLNSQSCEYSNFTLNSKNCYLVFGCVDDEDCAYGHIVWESKDSLDNLYLYKSELCYESVDCVGSYGLKYCTECESCNDCIGCYDCRSCTNCIGCVGLKQKSYHIFNDPVTKEEYESFVAQHLFTNPVTVPFILEKQKELRKKIPQRYFFGLHNNRVSGNHIYNAKNLHYSFDVKGGEDSKFIFTGRNAKDSYDVSFSPDVEQVYESITCSKTKNVYFSHSCNGSHDIAYCDTCFSSHNIFGCVGLRNAEYCILNVQYTKEEYEALREKIIAHMKNTGEYGEFFPVALSPFGYNEAIVNEYYPIEKETALSQGFRWSDGLSITTGQETIAHEALPKNPDEFTDALTAHTLKCFRCMRNYRLIAKEVGFYTRMKLPIPSECFNCRHARRMQMRNIRALWQGTCARCGTGFETSYSPEQQKEYKMYCEACYQNEVG
ncbi:MAG: hypothetical protein NUV53_01835 [Patescibacteria group bacterium]|nr:hypothetical protein [Patescibacteria group bacterium]